MSPRPRLTLLALSLTLPALAGAVAETQSTGARSFRYAAPLAAEPPGKRAKDAAPDEKQTPPPSGCPFRNGKLELMV